MKLLSIPFGQGSLGKNIGTEKAPAAILDALNEIYLNESGYKPIFEE